MKKDIFKEPFDDNFFLNHFGRKYIHKKDLINNVKDILSLEVLDDMLSKSNIWNNHNFIMMLDQKKISYNDYTSLSLDVSGSNNRPDVHKVQKLVSKGASIILNDIEKYNSNLLKIADQLQKLTYINPLPNEYNWLRLQLEHDEQNSWNKKIIHWTGRKGKDRIREKIGG